MGVVRVRSPLLAESLLSSLPPATEMFHFAGSGARRPTSSGGGVPLAGDGLPHSDTPGSRAACASPGLFAACRVLHRLPPPRHPPRARTAWAPKIGARPALRAVRPRARRRGPCCLTKKRRCAAEFRRRARFYQGEMSLRPRRGAKPRGGRSLCLAGGPGIPAPSGRSRTSFPVRCQRSSASPRKADQWKMVVGAHGLGPWTSSLSETRSNQLSYAPGAIRAPRRGDSAMRRAWTGAAFRRACSSIRR